MKYCCFPPRFPRHDPICVSDIDNHRRFTSKCTADIGNASPFADGSRTFSPNRIPIHNRLAVEATALIAPLGNRCLPARLNQSPVEKTEDCNNLQYHICIRL